MGRRSEYAELLLRPRLVQALRSLPEKASPEEIADRVLASVAGSSAKLTKGEVVLEFELMPSEPSEPPESGGDAEPEAPVL